MWIWHIFPHYVQCIWRSIFHETICNVLTLSHLSLSLFGVLKFDATKEKKKQQQLKSSRNHLNQIESRMGDSHTNSNRKNGLQLITEFTWHSLYCYFIWLNEKVPELVEMESGAHLKLQQIKCILKGILWLWQHNSVLIRWCFRVSAKLWRFLSAWIEQHDTMDNISGCHPWRKHNEHQIKWLN